MTGKNFATKSDIKRLEKAIMANREAIEGNREAIVGNSQEIKSLRQEFSAFKWEVDKKFQDIKEELGAMITKFKDEILSHIDPVMKELAAAREERAILGHQVDDHEKRISHLETVV
ncbi:hypothetical protein COT64_02325 [Candidatus Shapirobacteria bacterium CG09_land_8_20_14_0_10_39_12]|uniref:Uncharacterized protein n=2 Tax=Candidatus Shapironibacteriota TaxID=1752721 RepID=A0A2M8L6D3_9BACT|nr:MAG: hypothetical protein COT64_02325 [Candidatus Shapirobacteria bacterium CG09_land_8_20_14_0_10_39_12]PJE69366.1 MAG: hypothetical protein COU96_00105 [Candidatus Shapirobacteria bacterium CG10_big_fil_rev_8_21_14_0_10_38_14]